MNKKILALINGIWGLFIGFIIFLTSLNISQYGLLLKVISISIIICSFILICIGVDYPVGGKNEH